MIKKIFTFAMFASFIAYVLALTYLLFLKNIGFLSSTSLMERLRYGIGVNLVPFRTIGEYISSLFIGTMNIDIPITNLGGNLLLFMPLGFYLPFFSKKLKKPLAYVGVMATFIAIIEIIQFLSNTGILDVDDFILNLTGAFIGFMIFSYTPIQKLFNYSTQ